AWPAIDTLAQQCDELGFVLAPRLTVYPELIAGEGFLDEAVRPHVLAQSDASGLGRHDDWYSGAETTPPPAPTGRARSSAVTQILDRYEPGYRFEHPELVTL